MTLLTTATIPDHSPWHLASGIVVTLIGSVALMFTISYLMR